MEEDRPAGAIGAGGKGKKVRNPIKEEQRRVQEMRQEMGEQSRRPEILPQKYEDGSVILKDWTRSHAALLHEIADQQGDICWALALSRILQFAYNRDLPAAQQLTFAINKLMKHVVLGRREARADKNWAKGKPMAIASLRKAIDYIFQIGLEKDFGKKGPQMFTAKASFLTKEDASPDFIVEKLEEGPVGIIIDTDFEFYDIKNGIYTVQKPGSTKKEEDEDCRHALIIVAYGRTKTGELFFVVQNSWGPTWGVNGYGRIIIEETCPTFYLDSLVK